MSIDKISIYEKNLSRIHTWIRAVDTKLGVFIALQGVFLALITPILLVQFTSKYKIATWEIYQLIVIGYFLLGYAIVKCLKSLYSSLKVEKSNSRSKGVSVTEDQLSLTYFNHIANMTLEQFGKKMRALTAKSYCDELIGQIHASAYIATRKHNHFNDAMILFVPGVVLVISALCWLYLL